MKPPREKPRGIKPEEIKISIFCNPFLRTAGLIFPVSFLSGFFYGGDEGVKINGGEALDKLAGFQGNCNGA